MWLSRVMLCAGLCSTLLLGGSVIASASARPAIHDGLYSHKSAGASTGYSYVALFVGANGKEVVGGLRGSGANCTASPSLVAQDPNELNDSTVIGIKLPRSLPIAANGAFSFAGPVTLTPLESGASISFTEPISLSGRFTLGKVVAHKGVAVRIHFSAPAFCEAATPTTFSDQWNITDE